MATRARGVFCRAEKRVRPSLTVQALSLVALCLALPARAATVGGAPDPDLSTEGTRRAGPFHLKPVLFLKDVGYDDNIRFDSQENEGDTTGTAGASLQALLLTADRGGLVLSQEVDYVAFSRNTDLNHWNGFTRARGIFLLKSLEVSLEDRFASVRERPNTEIDQRLRSHDNALTAAIRTRSASRLGMRAYLRHERIDYSSEDSGYSQNADNLDRDETALSVVSEMRLLPKTTFLLEGLVERIEFTDPDQRGSHRAVSILPGVRFDPSATLQGEIKVGVKSFNAIESTDADTRLTVGEAHLATRLGHAARLKLEYSRDLVYSVVEGNLYFVGTEGSAAVEQFFSRRLSGEVLYGRGSNRYPVAIAATATDPFAGIRDDRITRYQISLRYRVSDQLAIVASGSRLLRDSTDDLFDRTRNLYAFGSTYGF
jgi:hypothetical protein